MSRSNLALPLQVHVLLVCVHLYLSDSNLTCSASDCYALFSSTVCAFCILLLHWICMPQFILSSCYLCYTLQMIRFQMWNGCHSSEFWNLLPVVWLYCVILFVIAFYHFYINVVVVLHSLFFGVFSCRLINFVLF